MEAADIRRPRELKDENRRLKQMYADLSLENRALKDVISNAKAAASKANEVDPWVGPASHLAWFRQLIYDRDWEGAEKEFKRAIELDPQYAPAHHWYSQYLMAKGQIEKSFNESRIALGLEPFDLSTNLHLGCITSMRASIDEAIEQLKKVMEWEPKFFLAHLILGRHTKCRPLPNLLFDEGYKKG